MTNTDQINAWAKGMTDDEREAYILQLTGLDRNVLDSRRLRRRTRSPIAGSSSVRALAYYSLSVAIRECIARENPTAHPNELGRYYHGEEPAGSIGVRW